MPVLLSTCVTGIASACRARVEHKTGGIRYGDGITVIERLWIGAADMYSAQIGFRPSFRIA